MAVEFLRQLYHRTINNTFHLLYGSERQQRHGVSTMTFIICLAIVVCIAVIVLGTILSVATIVSISKYN